jgi:2-polyprenyl-3-methyl-5-hydroxy-6-metoxy-1,4-benzoquinol methylase
MWGRGSIGGRGLVLGNLINRHDAVRFYRKLSGGHFRQIAEKFRIRGSDRVLACWDVVDATPRRTEWDEIPAIRRRWHTVCSGGRQASFAEHVAGTWLADRPGLRALSLGCGAGDREIAWAQLGAFASITAIDISAEQIQSACQQAKEAGLDDVLDFRVASAQQVLSEGDRFDVVLALQSLHHFSNVGETVALIAKVLAPGGLLIFDEYVGPSRFQWTTAQMRAANALLAALPAQRRVQNDGRVKNRVVRPSLLSMWLDDPSEAVQSAQLMPALRRYFSIAEEYGYGGILHLALDEIAHNFLDQDSGTAQLIEKCLAAEQQAITRLGHDFEYAVCIPRASQGQVHWQVGSSAADAAIRGLSS